MPRRWNKNAKRHPSAPRCLARFPPELRVGTVVVPRHLWDPTMCQRGVYLSVSTASHLSPHNVPLSSTRGLPTADLSTITATLCPLKAFVSRSERAWPVVVQLVDARLVPYYTYVVARALVTLSVSAAAHCARARPGRAGGERRAAVVGGCVAGQRPLREADCCTTVCGRN